MDGVRHQPATSPLRRLRVIDETDFATQLRRQLSAVRQNAIRIEAQQGEVQDDVIDGATWLEDPGVYWTITVRVDGRPHAVPLVGVWQGNNGGQTIGVYLSGRILSKQVRRSKTHS